MESHKRHTSSLTCVRIYNGSATQSSSDTRLKSSSHTAASTVAGIKITNKTGIVPPPHICTLLNFLAIQKLMMNTTNPPVATIRPRGVV